MLERTFLKEQVKKREEQQKEHHHQREERVREESSREKQSLWNRLRGRQDRPGQIIGIAPALREVIANFCMLRDHVIKCYVVLVDE